MTAENAKKLYEHFLKTGQKEKAAEIARGRPEVVQPEKKEKDKKTE